MKKRRIHIPILILLVLSIVSCNRSKVVIYPNPGELAPSKQYQVFANGHEVFVYDVPVFLELNNQNRVVSFAQFDFTGKVNIEIAVKKKIESVRIRPDSYGIKYTIKDNHVILALSVPKKICIDINNEIDENLTIFANQPEKEIYSKNDSNVLYYGPGEHYVPGTYGILQLKSNQTLYLAGGAVLHARILAKNAKNIKIKGRGMLDGTTLLGRVPDYYRKYLCEPDSLRRPNFVRIINCSNVEIEGVVFNNSPCWTLDVRGCENVNIHNLKEFGYVDNSDGIDITSCKNTIIDDVFIRVNDDCVVVKGEDGKDVDSVTVTNSVMWSDRAQALQIGHEAIAGKISNVRFSNIDILEQRNRYIGHYALGIFNGDCATISDIVFENIRVENCERLISMVIEKGAFGRSEKRGKIENVTFRNIYSYQKNDIGLFGFSEENCIKNVTFENINFKDQTIKPELIANRYVYNLTFKQDGKEVKKIDCVVAPETKFETIDITPWCNRSFVDKVRGDGQGWVDLGPDEDMSKLVGGIQEHNGIPFKISEDKDKGAIILRSSQHLTEQPYASYPIKISKKADYVFFLQGTIFQDVAVKKIPPVVWIYTAGILMFDISKIGTPLWYYQIRYEDGSEVEVPVKAGLNVEDMRIWAPGGWVTLLNGKKFYIQKWDNPYPEKTIETIKMFSKLEPEVPILMAITLGKK